MVKNTSQPEEEGLEIDTLDPKDKEKEVKGEPLEGLEDVILEESQLERVMHINNQLNPRARQNYYNA